jgi:DNA-binding MarR family transcriptional regulator
MPIVIGFSKVGTTDKKRHNFVVIGIRKSKKNRGEIMKKNVKPASPNAEKFHDLINRLQKVISEIDYSQKACMQAGKMECQLLHYLYGTSAPVNMNELARVLNVSHSRVTRIMDNLVEKSLVTRRPSEEDRRCWYAEITERGKKMAEASQQTVIDQQEKIIKYLTPDKVDNVLKSFEQYVKAYEKVLEETVID